MYHDYRFDAAYETGSDDQKAAAGNATDAVMAKARAPAITLLTKWRWMIAIIARRDLSDRAKVMAQAIADDYRDARGHARRGYTHLAKVTGSSVRTAQRAIDELVRAGIVDKGNEWDPEAKKYAVNFYRPVWDLVSSDLTIPHAADQGGIDRFDDTPYPEGVGGIDRFDDRCVDRSDDRVSSEVADNSCLGRSVLDNPIDKRIRESAAAAHARDTPVILDGGEIRSEPQRSRPVIGKTTLPADFEPVPDDMAAALARGIDRSQICESVAKWRDKRSESRSTSTDWHEDLQTWLAREKPRRATGSTPDNAGTLLPQEWQPGKDILGQAVDLGLSQAEIKVAHDKFVYYYRSVAGDKAWSRDWHGLEFRLTRFKN